MQISKKTIYFLISAINSKKNGCGGLSKLVNDLVNYLLFFYKEWKNDLEVISLFGEINVNPCGYKNTVLQNYLKHSPEFNWFKKFLFGWRNSSCPAVGSSQLN